MADKQTPWIMRALYLMICLSLLFVQLLPLDTLPRLWAAPDLMVAVSFAWVIRRPDCVTPLMIAMMFLLADLMVQRPPGLWAALVLIGCETLRNRTAGPRELRFAAEWLSVGLTLIIMTLAYRIVLGLTFVAQPPLGLSLIQMLMTLLAYPLVTLVTQTVFRVRRATPGGNDRARQRV